MSNIKDELKFEKEDSVEFHDFVADITGAMMDADVSVSVPEDDAWDMAVEAIRHLMGKYHLVPKQP